MAIDKRRGKHVARWRDADHKQHSRAFDRKRDAEDFLAEIRRTLRTGTYIDPSAGKLSVREYAEDHWLPAQVHLRPGSVARYGSDLRAHIVPLLGDRPLGALKRTDCKAFVAALAAGLAPATVHTVYAALRSLMQSAVDDGCPANPRSRVAAAHREARHRAHARRERARPRRCDHPRV